MALVVIRPVVAAVFNLIKSFEKNKRLVGVFSLLSLLSGEG